MTFSPDIHSDLVNHILQTTETHTFVIYIERRTFWWIWPACWLALGRWARAPARPTPWRSWGSPSTSGQGPRRPQRGGRSDLFRYFVFVLGCQLLECFNFHTFCSRLAKRGLTRGPLAKMLEGKWRLLPRLLKTRIGSRPMLARGLRGCPGRTSWQTTWPKRRQSKRGKPRRL